MLSVIIPAYNEEKMIPKTAEVIAGLLEAEKTDYEILFINDGSRDHTWEKICEAGAANPKVKGFCFARNFGKEAAMFAGLEKAEGDCAVIIDCDLQHPPEKILEMYHLWEEGYDVIEGVKEDRGKESLRTREFADRFSEAGEERILPRTFFVGRVPFHKGELPCTGERGWRVQVVDPLAD